MIDVCDEIDEIDENIKKNYKFKKREILLI